jgi:hypothetical protein
MDKLRHIHSKVGTETAFRIPVSVEDAIAEAVEDYDALKTRVAELEEFIDDQCIYDLDDADVLNRKPRQSLLLHDAALLERFYAQEDCRGADHGPGWFIWPQRLLDEASELRKQADALEGEGDDRS